MNLVNNLEKLDSSLKDRKASELINYAEKIKEFVEGRVVFIKDKEALVAVREPRAKKVVGISFISYYRNPGKIDDFKKYPLEPQEIADLVGQDGKIVGYGEGRRSDRKPVLCPAG